MSVQTTYVRVSEDALLQMVLNGLEAYTVRHAESRKKAKERVETYGLLWGHRRKARGGNELVSVEMVSVDTSAKREWNQVTPSSAALRLKRDVVDAYWPTREFVGDFHTHPWDPQEEADYLRIERDRLCRFSDGDYAHIEENAKVWREVGYRVGLVLTVTHLTSKSRLTPQVFEPGAIRFAIADYRLWLKAYVSRWKNGGLAVSPDDEPGGGAGLPEPRRSRRGAARRGAALAA